MTSQEQQERRAARHLEASTKFATVDDFCLPKIVFCQTSWCTAEHFDINVPHCFATGTPASPPRYPSDTHHIQSQSQELSSKLAFRSLPWWLTTPHILLLKPDSENFSVPSVCPTQFMTRSCGCMYVPPNILPVPWIWEYRLRGEHHKLELCLGIRFFTCLPAWDPPGNTTSLFYRDMLLLSSTPSSIHTRSSWRSVCTERSLTWNFRQTVLLIGKSGLYLEKWANQNQLGRKLI